MLNYKPPVLEERVHMKDFIKKNISQHKEKQSSKRKVKMKEKKNEKIKKKIKENKDRERKL